MLVSAANMADRDLAEHMVFISRGDGEGRIERKIRKSKRLAEQNRQNDLRLFSVSSEIIVLQSFLTFGQAHAILVCFLQTLFGYLSSYKYKLCYSLKKALFIWWRSSGATQSGQTERAVLTFQDIQTEAISKWRERTAVLIRVVLPAEVQIVLFHLFRLEILEGRNGPLCLATRYRP